MWGNFYLCCPKFLCSDAREIIGGKLCGEVSLYPHRVIQNKILRLASKDSSVRVVGFNKSEDTIWSDTVRQECLTLKGQRWIVAVNKHRSFEKSFKLHIYDTFCSTVPCNLLKAHWQFRGAYCLHHQDGGGCTQYHFHPEVYTASHHITATSVPSLGRGGEEL